MDIPKQADFQTRPEEDSRPDSEVKEIGESIGQSLDEAEGLLSQVQGLGVDIGEATREVRQAYWHLGEHEISKRQWGRQSAIIVASLFSAFYLVFRALYTLNLESTPAIIFSVTLLAAEAYGLFHLALYFYQVWRLVEPPIQPVPVGHTVDIFVTTYNEDVELLRNTLRACVEMEYPHTTYVLDDGNREEVQFLAEKVGAKYITRSDREHAKAGNVNNALRQTNGEFVVLLDADHVPHKHFITRLLGYFRDPKVGYVQAPHTTYNLDNFLGNWDVNSQLYWEDVRIFFEAVQLGKNRHGLACYCGSATMFRRKAIEDIGLFATETITEDLHTGMRINAAGWKSYAVNEDLVVGLAPEDPETFSGQRLRWGEGNLSVLAYDNPLTMKGLNLHGRINYFASILNWTYGPARLVMYLVPIVMLFTGIPPVAHLSVFYVAVVLGYLISVWTSVKVASNKCGNLLGIELAMMASFHLQLRGLWRAMFRRRFQRFIVTSKKPKAKPSILRLMWPQAMIVGLGITSISWATARAAFGLSADFVGLGIGSALALYHAWLGFTVLRNASRERAPDEQWQHPVQLMVRYSNETLEGQAVTLSLNEYGVTIFSLEPLPRDVLIEFSIDTPHSTAHCLGNVVDKKEVRCGKQTTYIYNVVFGSSEPALLWDEQENLERLLFSYAVPWIVMGHRKRRSLIDLSPRKDVENVPLSIEVKDNDSAIQDQRGVIEQIDKKSLVTTLAYPFNEGSTAEVKVRGSEGNFTVIANVANVQDLRVGTNVVHRHRFDWVQPTPKALSDSVKWMRKLHRYNHGFTAHERRKHFWYASIPSWTVNTVALIFVTTALFWSTHSDELLMVAAAERPLTPVEQTQVRKATEAGAESRFISTNRLLMMYHAAVDADQSEVAAKLATRLSARIPEQQCRWIATAASHWSQARQYGNANKLLNRIIASGCERRLPVDEQATIYLEAARVAVALGDIERSASLFTKAGDLRAFSQNEIDEYIGLLITANKLPQAFRVLEQMGDSDQVLRRIIAIYEIAKQPQLAVDALEMLHSEHPDEISITKRLAELAFERGDYNEAIQYYRQLLQRLPDDPTIRRQFAGVLAALKRTNEAVALLHNTKDPKSLILMASILETDGQFEQALKELRKVTGKAAQTLDYRKQFTRLLMATEQYDQAVRHLLVDLEKYPSNWKFQQDFVAAVAASNIGKKEPGVPTPKSEADENAIIRKVLSDIYGRYKSVDFQPLGLNDLAQLATAMGRFESEGDTIQILQVGVEKFPTSRVLRLRLAQALSNAGEYDAAEKQFAKLLGEKLK